MREGNWTIHNNDDTRVPYATDGLRDQLVVWTMLLSKVNRRVSVAIESQPRRSLDPQQKAIKKFAQKHSSKFPKKSKKTTNTPTSSKSSKSTADELNPPSDSDEDFTSSKLDKYWRPPGGKGVTFSADNDNTSIKAQAKAEFDSISKRITKVK